VAVTTCSRDVKTKSIWAPGTFTISTLGSSRRTRSMDAARNGTIDSRPSTASGGKRGGRAGGGFTGSADGTGSPFPIPCYGGFT
jgi:hypothetical protein